MMLRSLQSASMGLRTPHQKISTMRRTDVKRFQVLKQLYTVIDLKNGRLGFRNQANLAEAAGLTLARSTSDKFHLSVAA